MAVRRNNFTPMKLLLPSPVETLKLPSQSGAAFFIKRDDRIHPTVSGNKWRKLQLNVEKMRQQHQELMLTFGGAHSNHIAATAQAAALLGFRSIGIIRGDELDQNANDTLTRAAQCGMALHFVSRADYRRRHDQAYHDELRSRFGAFYLVPEGGANYLGMAGCSSIVSENPEAFDYYAVAAGTGTTAAGMLSALRSHQKLVVVPALKGASFLRDNMAKLLYQMYWDNALVEEKLAQLHFAHDYHFGGYAELTTELVRFMNEFRHREGFALDPVYTAKMMFAVCDLDQKGFFKTGEKVLTIHSGGLQGIAAMNEKLKKQGHETIDI